MCILNLMDTVVRSQEFQMSIRIWKPVTSYQRLNISTKWGIIKSLMHNINFALFLDWQRILKCIIC